MIKLINAFNSSFFKEMPQNYLSFAFPPPSLCPHLGPQKSHYDCGRMNSMHFMFRFTGK